VEAAGAAGVARGDQSLRLDADGNFSGGYEPRALDGGEVKLGQSKKGEEGEHGDEFSLPMSGETGRGKGS
jgi:hypothetical protein